MDAQLAVMTRVDVTMTVGGESVTAESPLRRSQDAEVSTALPDKQIANLPIDFGIGAGAIRNPLSLIQQFPWGHSQEESVKPLAECGYFTVR